MAGETRTVAVPEATFGSPQEHLRRTVQRVNGLLNGHGNNHHIIVLELDTTETRVSVLGATAGCVPIFSPLDAGAAASVALGAIYMRCEKDAIVITHDASAETRTLGVVTHG